MLILIKNFITTIFRSTVLEVFLEKCALKNFPKFTGKHQCQRPMPSVPLFTNIPGLQPASSLKKRLRYKFFPMNYGKQVAFK